MKIDSEGEKDLSALVSKLLKHRQVQPTNSDPQISLPPKQRSEDFSSANNNDKPILHADSGCENESIPNNPKGSVFDRLVSDAYNKQEVSKSRESAKTKKEHKSRGRKNSGAPRIEDKLIAHKKQRDNWLLQERFKQHSQAINQLNTGNASKKALMIFPRQ